MCLQAWAELEAGDGRWLTAVKLLEQAVAVNRQHLPSWMVGACVCGLVRQQAGVLHVALAAFHGHAR